MKFLLFIISLSVFLVGCSSSQDKREIAQRAKVSEVKNLDALEVIIGKRLENSKHLTKEQKDEIAQLLLENKKKSEDLTVTSYQYQSVLVQELFFENYDRKKIHLLKNTIQAIEEKRFENTLATLRKIYRIVAETPDLQKFVEAIRNYEPSLAANR